MLEMALEDACTWLKAGHVAVLDATNGTTKRRLFVQQQMLQRLPSVKVLFLESQCTDEAVLERNIKVCVGGGDGSLSLSLSPSPPFVLVPPLTLTASS